MQKFIDFTRVYHITKIANNQFFVEQYTDCGIKVGENVYDQSWMDMKGFVYTQKLSNVVILKTIAVLKSLPRTSHVMEALDIAIRAMDKKTRYTAIFRNVFGCADTTSGYMEDHGYYTWGFETMDCAEPAIQMTRKSEGYSLWVDFNFIDDAITNPRDMVWAMLAAGY